MIQAYVLIQTHVGASGRIAHELRAIEAVISAEPVTGPYDVVVRVEAADLDGLGKLVASRIHAVEGITRTITCLISGWQRP
jgi:DNA-binding Lrp family transcriptional regulator